MIGVSFPNKELWSSKKQQKKKKKHIKFKLLRSCMKIYGPPSSNNQSLKLDFSKLNSLHIAA